MTQPLNGQTVLVTGGTGGIGSAIVEQVAADGARVIIHYSHDASAAETLLSRIGGRGWLIQADLLATDGPFQLWAKAIEVAGRINSLVNNAGIRTEISIEASPSDWKSAWQKEFQINFFASADLSKEAINHFRKFGGGKIINICSRAGQRGYVAEAMPYGATKAALINLTKSIARSFSGDGVIAVALAPGWVRTPMVEGLIAANGEAAAVADIPIKAMASAAEVAEVVAFVLRTTQTSLNGATLDINGGSYIR